MNRQGVCLVGYGETKYVRPKGEDRSVLQYMVEACQLALANAGLQKKDVDGFAFASLSLDDDSPFVAEQLGLELDWVEKSDFGGGSALGQIRRAADAIQLGQIDVALCVSAGSFGGRPKGIQSYQRGNYVAPHGYGGPNSMFALAERRHMEQYGTTLEQLGKIAVSLRKNAQHNENALQRAPMTIEDYLKSRMISDPVRLYDCVMPCSGGAAVVLASERVAKGLKVPPIYLVSDAEKANYQVTNMMQDRTVTGFQAISGELFSKLSRKDVNFLQLYDDYPIAILIQLEDLGFCAKGEGGRFVDAHDLTYQGDLPVNTGGGELSVGQPSSAGAMLHVVEAMRQLRGDAGARQVKNARTGLVTGLGLLGHNVTLCITSAMVLQRR